MCDEEFDACECVWSHEFAMRRLLSMLRQGQSYCTDTECVDLIRPQTTPTVESSEGNNFMLLTMLTILALTLYVFRPMRGRRQLSNSTKSSGNDEDSNDGSPPPPAIH